MKANKNHKPRTEPIKAFAVQDKEGTLLMNTIHLFASVVESLSLKHGDKLVKLKIFIEP